MNYSKSLFSLIALIFLLSLNLNAQSHKDYYKGLGFKVKKYPEMIYLIQTNQWESIEKILGLAKKRHKGDFYYSPLYILAKLNLDKISTLNFEDLQNLRLSQWTIYNFSKIYQDSASFGNEILLQYKKLAQNSPLNSEQYYFSQFYSGQDTHLFAKVLTDSTLTNTKLYAYAQSEDKRVKKRVDFNFEIGLGNTNFYNSKNVLGNKFELRIGYLAEINRLNFQLFLSGKYGDNKEKRPVFYAQKNKYIESDIFNNTTFNFGLGYDILKGKNWEFEINGGFKSEEVLNYYDNIIKNYPEQEASHVRFYTNSKYAQCNVKYNFSDLLYTKLTFENTWANYKGSYMNTLQGNSLFTGLSVGSNINLKKVGTKRLLGK